MKKWNYNTDLIKMLCILSVIIVHAAPVKWVESIGSPFHLAQTIQMFLLIYGYNVITSIERRNLFSLQEIYRYVFSRKKITRIFAPLTIAYIIFIIIEWYFKDRLGLIDFFTFFINTLGGYYISILIQAMLITPLIYKLIKKTKYGILYLFLISLILELPFYILNRYIFFESVFIRQVIGVMYSQFIGRHLFAISLGAWHALNYQKVKMNSIVPLALVSAVYIYGVNYLGWEFLNENMWNAQHAPSFFWTLFLFIVLSKIRINEKSKIINYLAKIGKASFHVYLVQILYFWILRSLGYVIVPTKLSITFVLMSLIVCVSLGVIFYELESNFMNKLQYKEIKSQTMH